MGQARLGYRTIDALVGPFFVVRTNSINIKSYYKNHFYAVCKFHKYQIELISIR